MRNVTLFSRCVLPAALLCAFSALVDPARADPVTAKWAQPRGPGTDVVVSYSYSNLLDGGYRLIDPVELRAATEEALRLWASFAPIHFIERPDSGPRPEDVAYSADGHPQIRIGHHPMPEIAHAYFPDDWNGLGGDVHFDSGLPWTLGAGHWNFLEAVTHELGHALGLPHDSTHVAIMNASFPQHRFDGLGTAFLLPADIDAIQAVYGSGRGSVQPLNTIPEPATLLLVGGGIAACLRARRRGAVRHLP